MQIQLAWKFFRVEYYFRSIYEDLSGNDQVVCAICHDSVSQIGNVSVQINSLINRNAEFTTLIEDRNH